METNYSGNFHDNLKLEDVNINSYRNFSKIIESFDEDQKVYFKISCFAFQISTVFKLQICMLNLVSNIY